CSRSVPLRNFYSQAGSLSYNKLGSFGFLRFWAENEVFGWIFDTNMRPNDRMDEVDGVDEKIDDFRLTMDDFSQQSAVISPKRNRRKPFIQIKFRVGTAHSTVYSLLTYCALISAGHKPCGGIVTADGFECIYDGCDKNINRAGFGGAKKLLYLAPHFFYRIQIG
ncbi:MAG: hypothetical protein L0Y36_06080, partial [Planctomycetales bacterium]|nr:hypothetical protein [Planctomycetales bacterium]